LIFSLNALDALSLVTGRTGQLLLKAVLSDTIIIIIKDTVLVATLFHIYLHIHTYIHPFNGPFSGTTQVSWYQKGKTNLDFTEARDSEWQWHQLGHM